jgi:hypothetical protein
MGVEQIVLPARGPLKRNARRAKRSAGSDADRRGGRELSRGSPPSNIVSDCNGRSTKEKQDFKDTSPFCVLTHNLVANEPGWPKLNEQRSFIHPKRVAARILVKNPETWPDTAFRVGSSHRNRQRETTILIFVLYLGHAERQRYRLSPS